MVRNIENRLDQRIIVDQYQGFQRISSVVQIIPAVANRLSGRSIDPPLDILDHCPLYTNCASLVIQKRCRSYKSAE